MTEEANAPRHVRRQWWRPVAAWVGLAAVAAAGYSTVYANTVVDQFDGALGSQAHAVDELVGSRPERTSPAGESAPLTILVMGSDSRAGGDNQDAGGGDVEGMRNDTTILVHISGDRSRVQAVSIPRDAQVDIPDCTFFDGDVREGAVGDFNVAFSHGGERGNAAEAAACTIKTVENLTGIYIDHYAVVDFAGFIGMIDALGGVPMCIPTRIVSAKAHIDLQPGPQVLDGKTALGYARLRTAEEGGVSGSDLQRITRQQQLLHQMATTVLSKNLLTDVGELTHFLRAAANSVTMDPELASTAYLVGLAYSLRDTRPADIDFETVPWAYTKDGLNVRIEPEAEQMWEDIRNDRPLSVAAEGDASSEWDDGRKAESSPEPATTPAGEPSTSPKSTVEDLLLECR